jgi:hypothetical protein
MMQADKQPPAAEDQHRERDPADLRVVAAADAADHHAVCGQTRRGRRAPWGDFMVLALNQYLAHGIAALHGALCSAGIIFFCFFYTAVVFNPEETADNLKRYGGFIPGIRPARTPRSISIMC